MSRPLLSRTFVLAAAVATGAAVRLLRGKNSSPAHPEAEAPQPPPRPRQRRRLVVRRHLSSKPIAVSSPAPTEAPRRVRSRPVRRLVLRQIVLFLLALATGSLILWAGPSVTVFAMAETSIFEAIAAQALGAPVISESSGKDGAPRAVRPIIPSSAAPPAPAFLGITDDPRRVFESSPPSPADYAVMLRQLHQQNVSSVALSLPLIWENPDPIALDSLKHRLESFSPAITVAPLTRSISSRPIPDAFRRASVPVADVGGNPRLLPAVNRSALEGVLLGGGETWAGFSSLENEDPPDFSRHARGEPVAVPLVARWDDRVVFSFPLLVVVARAGTTPDQVRVELGKHLRLGIDGPVIPVDAHGRFHLPPSEFPPSDAVPAEALIEALLAEESATPFSQSNFPVIFRDDRPHSPDAEGAAALGPLVAAMEKSPRFGEAVAFKPLDRPLENALLVLPALLVAACLRLRRPLRVLTIILVGGVAFVALAALARTSHIQANALPVVGVLMTGLVAGSGRCTAKPAPSAASLDPSL